MKLAKALLLTTFAITVSACSGKGDLFYGSGYGSGGAAQFSSRNGGANGSGAAETTSENGSAGSQGGDGGAGGAGGAGGEGGAGGGSGEGEGGAGGGSGGGEGGSGDGGDGGDGANTPDTNDEDGASCAKPKGHAYGLCDEEPENFRAMTTTKAKAIRPSRAAQSKGLRA